MRGSRSSATPRFGVLLVALVCFGCGDDAAPSSEPLASLRGRVVLEDASGAFVAAIVPRDDDSGWRLEDAEGTKTGSLRVGEDRVSMKDAGDQTRAKAKRRDDGFKVEDGGDQTVLKIQRREGRYRLKRGDDVIGAWRTERIELEGGVVIDTTHTDGVTEVRRGGVVVQRVTGPIPTHAAVFFGLTEELTFEQRLAAVIFVRELRFP